MSTALLIRDDGALSVSITESAMQAQSDALDTAALIARVSSPEDNDKAVAAQRGLKELISNTEKARKAAKEPVLEFGRKIDVIAKSFVAPLESEMMRISKLVGDYMAKVEAQRKAEEAARLLEQQKIERERQLELARIADEERQKLLKLEAEAKAAADAAAAAKNAEDAAKAAELQREIDRQRALAEAQSLQKMEAAQESFNAASASIAPPPEAIRATGQIAKEVIVIDQIRELELLRARPDLVRKVEFDMIEIKRLLDSGVKLPGVTFHREMKATVRTGGGRPTITIGGAA